ncbi:hypothetical protein XENOCAPTIV_030724 [Xenoophorus captivus]|uniref:Secreted protein n=1 Tax=Xenoophorus captivus TaxID=1517983 RepID=A0ABV0QXI8_9TELE
MAFGHNRLVFSVSVYLQLFLSEWLYLGGETTLIKLCIFKLCISRLVRILRLCKVLPNCKVNYFSHCEAELIKAVVFREYTLPCLSSFPPGCARLTSTVFTSLCSCKFSRGSQR